MTISVTEPGLPPEQPGAPRSAGGPETSAAFLALLTALMPQAVPTPPVTPATGGGAATAGPVGALGVATPLLPGAPDPSAAPTPTPASGLAAFGVPAALPAAATSTAVGPTVAGAAPTVTVPSAPAGTAQPVVLSASSAPPATTAPVVDQAALQEAGLQTAVLRAATGVGTPPTDTLTAPDAPAPSTSPAGAPARPAAEGSAAALLPGPDAPVAPTAPTASTEATPVAATPDRERPAAATPTVPQVAPVPTAAPVQAGTPVPPAAPVAAAPPAVHLQVLQAVTPVVHGPGGSYSIQLQLAPNDLGQVQVTVDMTDGQVSIHLHADDPAAGVALRDSLPQLREQLEQQGLRTGSLDVGSGDAQRRPPPQNTPGLGGVSAPGPAEDPILPTRAAHPAGALDVRL